MTKSLNSVGDRSGGEPSERRVLAIVMETLSELHPGIDEMLSLSLDSDLDRELGFDSLGRTELLYRLEKAFEVRLPESTFSTADTPRDLLKAIHNASPLPVTNSGETERVLGERRVEVPGEEVATLPALLLWHARRHPHRRHISFYDDHDQVHALSYSELLDGARRVAACLQARGLEPGDSVAIMLPTGEDYFFSFMGILLAGGVPVPIYPPMRLSQIEEHLRRHVGILANARCRILITMPEAQSVAKLLKTSLRDMARVMVPDELRASNSRLYTVSPLPTDTAFLQYTSGSTGNPKGVVLSHTNLLTNIRAMGGVVEATPDDVFVSWLPLYHDMGLIGAWLGSLYFAMSFVVMTPLAFLARPQRWLWAIHQHRGTLSAGPNFAYELCLNKLDENDVEGLDLSSWRLAFNGAEPVSPQTVRRFCRRFGRYGFHSNAMAPVYGLAESSVGLAFPPPGRSVPIDRVDRSRLSQKGEAVSTVNGDNSLEFVACGSSLPGHQIRVVDAAGNELPDRIEGRLQFKGPSCTRGYFENEAANHSLFERGWLNSGDLAYLDKGEVYLTGRVKDMIIRAGRNIYPQELEQAIGEISRVRKGCVAVFGSIDPKNQTERLVIIAESRERAAVAMEQIRSDIMARVTDLLGMPPDQVIVAPLHAVLKTSSGKIRRAATRERYEQGDLGSGEVSVWKQFARLYLGALAPAMKQLVFFTSAWGYGAYAWSIFLLMAPVVWLLALLLPGIGLRWKMIGGAARVLARLVGCEIRTEGVENLPADHSAVLVANHQSYLDGIVLAAVLSRPVRFIAKDEFLNSLIPRIFLQRIDARFVSREDLKRSVEDARRLALDVRGGAPLLFFPEGTFRPIPGLLPFRMGGFVAAAEAGVVVIPVVICGTRSILRSGSWLPRRGAVSVSVQRPIEPQGEGWAGAVGLRNRSRSAMLERLDEPDLSHTVSYR